MPRLLSICLAALFTRHGIDSWELVKSSLYKQINQLKDKTSTEVILWLDIQVKNETRQNMHERRHFDSISKSLSNQYKLEYQVTRWRFCNDAFIILFSLIHFTCIFLFANQPLVLLAHYYCNIKKGCHKRVYITSGTKNTCCLNLLCHLQSM